jgi:ubiquinone/menaquinone biosynthesis C-methylase UbiE
MIARAARKARRAGLDVAFAEGAAQAIPYAAAQFDVVVSTLMLHHLPREARQASAREMRRVAKPGGRVLVIDFAAPSANRHGLLAHLHRHGHTKLDETVALLGDAGLSVLESGAVGRMGMQFVLASTPH